MAQSSANIRVTAPIFHKESLIAAWLESKVQNLLESETSSKEQTKINRAKLPADCFLWVEDEKKRSTWMLPYREGAGEIDPRTGMYESAGPVNLKALCAINAVLSEKQGGKPVSIPQRIKSKIKRLLKQYSIGEHAPMEYKGVVLTEGSFGGQFTGTKLDKETRTISGVAILRPTSVNKKLKEAKGRIYTDKARESVARLVNGIKIYRNHQGVKEAEEHRGVRKIEDLVGYLENGHVAEGGVVRGDLKYLSSAKEWLEPVVEEMHDKVGLSIDAFGDMSFDHNTLMENVEDIAGMRSVDMVTEPGSTISLFESAQKEIENDEQEESMDPKQIYESLDIESLKAKRPDLVTFIESNVKADVSKDDEIKALKESVKSLTEANTELKKKVDEYEVKESVQAKEAKISTLLKESGLKEEHVTATFRESLSAAENEDKMKALIEDRKKLITESTKGVKGMGDEAKTEEHVTESDDEKKKAADEYGRAIKG